jgi:hypothetical protein
MTPNPNPPAPPSSSSSQPTLLTFFSRTSSAIRQSVSSALDMTPAPTQRGARRRDLSSSSDSSDDMDMSENRKRSRPEDSILGDDIVQPSSSASMIANTSIMEETGPRTRRRLSSSEAGPSISPDLTSTPEQPNTQSRIQAQMTTVRDEIILEETSPQISINRNTNHDDHSTTAEQFNLTNMVSGVRQLTRNTANIQDPSPSSLTWDDTDINIPSLPMISPRAVPVIDENEANPLLLPSLPIILPFPVPAIAEAHAVPTPSLTPPPTGTSPPSGTQTTPDMLHSIKDMVREQFREAYENIEAKLIDSLTNHVRTSQQQYEENKEATAVVSARADNIEQDIERHQFEIESLNDDIETHSGHINRIDEAIGNLTHARVQPINTPDIQALMARIAALEESVQRSQLSEEMVNRFKKQAQREDDKYFMSTLSIKGFRPDVVGHNVRQSARNVLRIVGAEDVISYTNKISFKSGNTRMRITFDHPNDLNAAIHTIAKSIKQIKDNGQNPGITFSTLTPPRFGRERDILHEMAEKMKREGQISRYHFVMIKNQLCMKLTKPGQRDSILAAPAEAENMGEAEDMEVTDHDQEQAGSRCPICLGPFDTTQINVYGCGHTFHAACLRSSLSQSMKCPTCRSIPNQVQLDSIECTGCRNDILDPQSRSSQDHMVLSRRCGHLHLYDCQMSYLNTLEGTYPQTPEGYNDIRTAENIQGCKSCYLGNATNFQDNNFIHDVAFEPGMTDYVDLENVGNLAPAQNPSPQPNPAPVLIPIPQPPLSGANAIPIIPWVSLAINRPVPSTNRINRPTISPPPPPNRRGNARN